MEFLSLVFTAPQNVSSLACCLSFNCGNPSRLLSELFNGASNLSKELRKAFLASSVSVFITGSFEVFVVVGMFRPPSFSWVSGTSLPVPSLAILSASSLAILSASSLAFSSSSFSFCLAASFLYFLVLKRSSSILLIFFFFSSSMGGTSSFFATHNFMLLPLATFSLGLGYWSRTVPGTTVDSLYIVLPTLSPTARTWSPAAALCLPITLGTVTKPGSSSSSSDVSSPASSFFQIFTSGFFSALF